MSGGLGVEAARFARFALVGGTGFMIDAGLLTVLHHLAGIDPFTARLVSITASALTTWRLNRRLTFGASERGQAAEGLLYALVAAITAALNYLQAPDLAAAQKTVDEANAKLAATQKTIDQATSDLNAELEKIHSVTPQDELGDARRQAATYQQNYTAAVAGGNPTAAAVWKQALDQENARVLVLSNAIFPVTVPWA